MSSSKHSSTSPKSFTTGYDLIKRSKSSQQAQHSQRIKYYPIARSADQVWRSRSNDNMDLDAAQHTPQTQLMTERPASSGPVPGRPSMPTGTQAEVQTMTEPGTANNNTQQPSDPQDCKNKKVKGQVLYYECPCTRCVGASRSVHLNRIWLGMMSRNEARKVVVTLFRPFGEIDIIRLWGNSCKLPVTSGQVRFKHQESAVAAVQSVGNGDFMLAPPHGRIRISFPFFSQFYAPIDQDAPAAWLNTGAEDQGLHRSDDTSMVRSTLGMSSGTAAMMPAQDKYDVAAHSDEYLGNQTVIRRPKTAGRPRLPSSWATAESFQPSPPAIQQPQPLQNQMPPLQPSYPTIQEAWNGAPRYSSQDVRSSVPHEFNPALTNGCTSYDYCWAGFGFGYGGSHLHPFGNTGLMDGYGNLWQCEQAFPPPVLPPFAPAMYDNHQYLSASGMSNNAPWQIAGTNAPAHGRSDAVYGPPVQSVHYGMHPQVFSHAFDTGTAHSGRAHGSFSQQPMGARQPSVAAYASSSNHQAAADNSVSGSMPGPPEETSHGGSAAASDKLNPLLSEGTRNTRSPRIHGPPRTTQEGSPIARSRTGQA